MVTEQNVQVNLMSLSLLILGLPLSLFLSSPSTLLPLSHDAAF